MFRHALATLMTLLLALALAAYLDPYSLHRVIVADVAGFETPPADDGIVRIGNEEIDFRLPQLSLDDSTRMLVRDEVPEHPDEDFETVVAIVAFERSRLNAVDDNLPKVDEHNISRTVADGETHLCLCSAYARAFVEIAQFVGLQARVLWLEGHVAAEYFDRQQQSWVYVDPQLGVVVVDEDGEFLAVATIVERLEQDEPVEFRVIADGGAKAIDFDELSENKPLWYRNVLLNGETRAYSGATLAEAGRWQVLLKHGQRPAVLMLRTAFDGVGPFPPEPLAMRKVLIAFAGIWGSFYAFVLLVGARKTKFERPLGETRAETFPADSG